MLNNMFLKDANLPSSNLKAYFLLYLWISTKFDSAWDCDSQPCHCILPRASSQVWRFVTLAFSVLGFKNMLNKLLKAVNFGLLASLSTCPSRVEWSFSLK